VRGVLLLLLLSTVVAAQPARRDDPHPVRVDVVIIAASTTDKTIDKKLEEIAPVIQKSNPTLVGFKIVEGQNKRVRIGDTGTFKLDGDEEFKVKVDRGRDKDGSIGLTVSPPGSGEISYSCTSGKYVPFVTDVTTKAGDKILVAVMARPAEPRRKK
jgi:hypothetical protein